MELCLAKYVLCIKWHIYDLLVQAISQMLRRIGLGLFVGTSVHAPKLNPRLRASIPLVVRRGIAWLAGNRLDSVVSLAMEGSCEQEDGLAKKLWEGCKREALFALYHPFVVSLAAGTLELESFQRYIAQDAFFLTAFAQAYGMAMENTDDKAAKLAISELQQAAYKELELHSSLAKAWNVEIAQYSIPNPATTAYTTFLLNSAAGKDEHCSLLKNGEGSTADKRRVAAFTLGAMTPCMRLYAFLGQEIRRAAPEHAYHQWISTYSSAEFEASARQIEHLLERLSAVLVADDFATLESFYRRAMAFEVNFFSAQSWDTRSSNVPLLRSEALRSRSKVILVSDFDSTCTVSDSCPVLAELAMITSTNESELRSRWNTLSDEYLKDYSQLLDKVLRRGDDRPYRYDDIKQALQDVSEFEKQGNSKVVASKVLQGLKLDDIREAAHKMPLQVGCANVFQRLSSEGSVSSHILSVCWSQTFIEAALSKGGIKVIDVHSNELSNDGVESDGSMIRRIETPVDKERVLLDEILKGGEQHFVIYVGDSLTDLLCLLQADLGIVVGDSSSLNRAADAFGVKIVPLYPALVLKVSAGKAWRKEDGVLYKASGWLEIEAFLLGHKS